MQEKQFFGRGPGGFHRVVYTEWGQASARPPIVCVHGLVRNGRDFDYLARTLADEGRQVFCPDIVGRGKSDWLANPAGYNYAQYLTDMAALIARTGADSVDWVGTSMGGLIGMLLAAEANTPIRRLVLMMSGRSYRWQHSSASLRIWSTVRSLTISKASKNIYGKCTPRLVI